MAWVLFLCLQRPMRVTAQMLAGIGHAGAVGG